jgi:NitT/TauT family transport system ATP-binding protein
MVRWGHAPLSNDMLAKSKAVFRSDLYDTIIGNEESLPPSEPADGVGAFAGAPFDANDVSGHISAWKIRRW